jgi:hypothetical protein
MLMASTYVNVKQGLWLNNSVIILSGWHSYKKNGCSCVLTGGKTKAELSQNESKKRSEWVRIDAFVLTL